MKPLSQELDKSMLQVLSSEKAGKETASNSKGTVNSGHTNTDTDSEHFASAGSAGWELKKKGERAWLQTIRPAPFQTAAAPY